MEPYVSMPKFYSRHMISHSVVGIYGHAMKVHSRALIYAWHVDLVTKMDRPLSTECRAILYKSQTTDKLLLWPELALQFYMVN